MLWVDLPYGQGRAAFPGRDRRAPKSTVSARRTRQDPAPRCGSGEMARLRECRSGAIPGSVDATAAGCDAVGEYLSPVPGELETFGSCGRTCRRRLQWIDNYGRPRRATVCRIRPGSAPMACHPGWKGSLATRSFSRGREACRRARSAFVRGAGNVFAQSGTPRCLAPRFCATGNTTRLDFRSRALRQHFRGAFWWRRSIDHAFSRSIGLNFHAVWFPRTPGCPADRQRSSLRPRRRSPPHCSASACFSGWGIRTVALIRRAV